MNQFRTDNDDNDNGVVVVGDGGGGDRRRGGEQKEQIDARLDLNVFQTHLNCSFDLNDLLRLGNEAYDAEQMGFESCLERTEFEPSQLTDPCQFLALMIIMGITFNHDALLLDALRMAHSSLEWLVLQQFAQSRSSDYEPIDPRAFAQPIDSAEAFMSFLDSLQMPRFILSPFVAACWHGRIDLVQQWIPFAIANEYTRSLADYGLSAAIERDHVDVAETILPHVDHHGRFWPLLCTAIECKAMRVVAWLTSDIVATDEWPDDLLRVFSVVVSHGDVDLAECVFDFFDGHNDDLIYAVPAVVRTAAALGNAGMLRLLFERFAPIISPNDISAAFGNAKSDGVFQILFERLNQWSGDASAFDDALSTAVTATATAGDVEKLKLVLKIQLRERGAYYLRAYPWFEVFQRGDEESAAVLLADPRIGVTLLWKVFGFQRHHCRTIVTVCEHPRMFGAFERELDDETPPGLLFQRRCVARMWLTDICMALRPLRLPSLVVDEIVRHLPTMTRMQSEERLTEVIIKINERRS
jgi:hypothetical protein